MKHLLPKHETFHQHFPNIQDLYRNSQQFVRKLQLPRLNILVLHQYHNSEFFFENNQVILYN